MKQKTLLILLISMLSLSAFSQTGGGIRCRRITHYPGHDRQSKHRANPG